MLPSFRLIAATFLCGFVVVFAGLRLAASLNDIHEGLPVMAAHAAPVSITPAADHEDGRGLSSVPVMFDLRFAVTPVLAGTGQARATGVRPPGRRRVADRAVRRRAPARTEPAGSATSISSAERRRQDAARAAKTPSWPPIAIGPHRSSNRGAEPPIRQPPPAECRTTRAPSPRPQGSPGRAERVPTRIARDSRLRSGTIRGTAAGDAGKSAAWHANCCHDPALRPRPFARHHRQLRPAGAAQQHRPRAASPTGSASPAIGWPSITTCRTSRARRPTS